MTGMTGGKAFGVKVTRKEILTKDLLPLLDDSIPLHWRKVGIRVLPGESNDSFRIGKGLVFNKKTYDYVDNIGFFPEVWVTAPEGEVIAKNIIDELELRGFKPRLHRGLPEVLQ